jgi:DegV family protein with EDD domain
MHVAWNLHGEHMSTVRIVTDSACDLAGDVVSRLGITVVPLSIRFGNEEFTDRVHITADQFWNKLASSSQLPETAAPSPGAFETAFRQAKADGAPGVVCVTLSSKLSATYQSAALAAKAVAGDIDVRVVDSLSITMGLGTMCVAGAEAASFGASLDAVEQAVQSFVGRTHVYGAVDTLDNLKKGGRIGGAQAFIGTLLSVKPILDISTGVVEAAGKQRTRAKSFAHLTSLVVDAKAKHGSVAHLAVMHGNATDIDDLLNLLEPHYPREQIVVGPIGAVIGTHGGRGVVGVTFDVPSSSSQPVSSHSAS